MTVADVFTSWVAWPFYLGLAAAVVTVIIERKL